MPTIVQHLTQRWFSIALEQEAFQPMNFLLCEQNTIYSSSSLYLAILNFIKKQKLASILRRVYIAVPLKLIA
jgi:hypothetical protein